MGIYCASLVVNVWVLANGSQLNVERVWICLPAQTPSLTVSFTLVKHWSALSCLLGAGADALTVELDAVPAKPVEVLARRLVAVLKGNCRVVARRSATCVNADSKRAELDGARAVHTAGNPVLVQVVLVIGSLAGFTGMSARRMKRVTKPTQ